MKQIPVLTLSLVTGEKLKLDLSVRPPYCASHGGEIAENSEKLTITVEDGLLRHPETVDICASCLREHAPKALEVLTR